MKTLKDIKKIIDIYQSTYLLEQSDIYDLSLSRLGNIEWLTPSPAKPQILDTYKLSPPFYYDLRSHTLGASKEMGQRKEILWAVKCLLGEIIQNLH